MARRRRGRKGKKGSRAFPLFSIIPIMPAASRFLEHSAGPVKDWPAVIMFETTGYDYQTQTWDQARAVREIGLVVAALIGHKLANRVGLNRAIKRVSMGMLQL